MISLIVLVLLWQAAANLLASPDLPSPAAVARFIASVAASGDLARHLGATLARVAAAFALTMIVGKAIGVALGRSPRADLFFDGWLIVALNLPALLVAVLAYVWLGLTDTAAVLAVAINKIPSVAVTLREGARSLDPALDEMATAFRFGPMRRLRHVVLPALAPFAVAAARNGLAMVWKIVLFVELLGRPNGIGAAIHTAFQLFDLTAVVGWSTAFVAVVLAVEHLVLEPIDRHVGRWRNR
ncbi:MAG: ABC transporter permease subunit [Phyllobacteriaceae bacterium]|nr:ABC transporter permease subunit [Phyllobacteriaceae bacterium]